MARRSRLTEAALAKLGAKRLAALLLAEAARNRDLKRALQIELDGERGVDEVVKTLTKRLTAIDNARSDVSTVKARELKSELERIHATIIEKVSTEAPDAALELLWRFINLHQNVLERVFEPSFTTKAGGHGFGLSTSYRIVHLHGGTITAESELGRGATFRVVLPVKAPAGL